MGNNLIKIKNLFFSYKKDYILKNINIDIDKNTINSIYGPSGSGKTTLLFILSGLINEFQGERKINFNFKKGFLFQKNNLLKDLTVYENIKISQLIKNENNDDLINEMMNDLKVIKLKGKYPSELSTGEEQRISFIKNIISNDVIFFDEPTSSLDSENAEEIINIIYKYSKNKTFVIATHDKRIKKISNKIFYLKDGEITIKSEGIKNEK